MVVGGEYKNESSNTFHIHNTIEVFDKVENQWKLGTYIVLTPVMSKPKTKSGNILPSFEILK